MSQPAPAVGRFNEARWFYAPTGCKGIAQGKAQRRPGVRYATIFASPERAERYHGETHARFTHSGRAPTATSYPTHPGWRCALPWAISLCPVGANDPVTLVGLHRLAAGGYAFPVATRCQAVNCTREKQWGYHRLATGGYGRQVSTRDRWLRAPRSHSLPSGGLALGKTSTVWRQVATGGRWLRATGGYALPVATRCQAVD
jgi:hypothetical protein